MGASPTNVQTRGLTRVVKSSVKDLPLVKGRRDQLVSAAVKVFQEKGFHDATIRDIGRAARMTQGTIYNYVRSKDDILYLVCDRLVSEHLEEAQRALSETANSAVRIEAIAHVVAKVMYDHQDEILLIYQNSHLLDRKSLRLILARIEAFVAFIETLIGQVSEHERVRVDDVHFAAHIFTFLPTMIALRRWAFKGKMSRDQLVAKISSFLMRGLGFPAIPGGKNEATT